MYCRKCEDYNPKTITGVCELSSMNKNEICVLGYFDPDREDAIPWGAKKNEKRPKKRRD